MLHSKVVIVPRDANQSWQDYADSIDHTIFSEEKNGCQLVNLTTLAPQTGQQSAVVALTFVTQVKT